MPVNNNYEIVVCKGNSTGRIFNFPFRCFSIGDLVVEYINERGEKRTLVQNSEYKVQGGLDNSGGMVTYPLESELPALSANESLCISRKTPLSQAVDFPTYQQAIENALDKSTMIAQETSAINAISVANNALVEAVAAVSAVADKVDRDGSNIDRLPFLSALGIGSCGEIDLTDLTLTDGSNADTVAFKTLVGMPEIESGISDLDTELTELQANTLQTSSSEAVVCEFKTLLGMDEASGLAIRPQTIVKGVTSDPVIGCDPLAEHLEISNAASSELVIHPGLQVAAGVDGATVLSNELASEATLDMSAESDGTYYIYADIGANNDMSFRFNDCEPEFNNRRGYDIVPVMTADTSQGWVASASSTYPGDSPYMAFNSNTSGGAYQNWNSGNNFDTTTGVGDEWLAIQKEDGSEFLLTGVELFGGYTTSQNGLPEDVVIEVYDGTDWSQLKSRTLSNWTDGVGKVIPFDDCLNVRGVRVRIYKVSRTEGLSRNYACIREFQIFTITESDLYDTSSHSHYDFSGSVIRRVYIGECTCLNGIVTDVINYQHGTAVTIPVNDGANITVNSTYYLDKPYLGSMTGEVQIYHEEHWEDPDWHVSSSGTRVRVLEHSILVRTGPDYVGTYNLGTSFSTYASSVPARVIAERVW